ncbi:hypothetical protein DFR70_110108 [Nocardia tenerifensis]|uniref:Sigma-70-like protein n=1 Tax=Nocardia tenerifensis TaxID=228006 RepID=A0A318JYA2_9NOCA|nr:hypothetical protein DFR70_110108 [Nocardia tenerifensis]
MVSRASVLPDIVTGPPATPELLPRSAGCEDGRARQALNDLQRRSIVLAYYGGRTYREVAEPDHTIKTQRREGLVRPRENWGELS